MLAPICIFKVLEFAFWPILWSFCGCPWLVDWLWVKLTSQNCSLYRPTVHPRVIAMRIMVWWYWLGLPPNSSTRVLWQPPVLSGGPVSRDISGASRRMGERNENLVYLSLWDFKRSLPCHKILQHGTSGFTFYLKEGVRQIFIALKNPLPWQGLNPQPLDPVASTLTTTPPRWCGCPDFLYARAGDASSKALQNSLFTIIWSFNACKFCSW
jgi:hypothetical protein